MFGRVTRGEGLYRAKGCNECHGLRAEGTSPAGKRPAPQLLGQAFPAADDHAMITAGTGPHAGHLGLHRRPALGRRPARHPRRGSRNRKAAAATRSPCRRRGGPSVLAYERDGKPMSGREGLIQLVVGADEFASRYSHWVSEIRVR